jgi:hypothetical protein
MPIEIRELQITTVVQDNPPASTSTAPSPSASTTGSEDIIAACVEQVMEILKQKNER